MGVVVRPAGPADADRLARVAAETFALACPPHATQESIDAFIADVLSTQCFERYLADPDRDLFLSVAEDAEDAQDADDADDADDANRADGLVTGYAMVVHADPTDPEVQAALTLRPSSELSKIYVRPDQHGAGTSRLLMGAAIAAARTRGAAGVWLGVNQLNDRAQRFYAKSGFTLVGTKRFLLGGRYEDDYVFERPA